jgi:para-nitrobenzyl esterase
VRPATTAGAVCTQPGQDTNAPALVGSEDCLTLNVFAPRNTGDAPLPVMLFIHGGGQMYGTGATYDGSLLAESQGVLVVTINYRLGPFGWFHHPAITDAGGVHSSGQFGLMDMIAALEWVQRNIAAFGGDPGNVTVFGESAGAQDVYALVLSPAAHGLFHKAIAQSGGLWNMTPAQAVNFRDDPVPGTVLSGREVASALLIAGGKAATARAARRLQQTWAPTVLAAWLRALPAADLLAPYAQDPHAGYDLPSVVYDGVLLPRGNHRLQLAAGRYNRVPMIIGGNRDEEKAFLAVDGTEVSRAGGRSVIRRPAEYAALNRYYSDWWNFAAVDDLAPRLHTPVYAYRFDWDHEPTEPVDLKARYGAAHGMELAFLFGRFTYAFVFDDLPPAETAPPPDPERMIFTPASGAGRAWLSAAMMSYWAAFAYDGDPGTGRHHELPRWPSWRAGGEKLLLDSPRVRAAPARIDGAALRAALWRDAALSAAQKCAIFLDNTMYPSYPLAALAAHHCRR